MKFFTSIALFAAGVSAAPTGTTSTTSTTTGTSFTKRAQLCSNFNGFADNSTSSSPLVGNCLRIFDRPPHWEVLTYNVAADPRWTNLWSYRDCMFGVRAKTVDAQFSEDDQAHLARAVLEGKAPTDRIEGTGVVACGEGETEWAFYTTRDSEWL